jgi:type I restriction enzyme S subunit
MADWKEYKLGEIAAIVDCEHKTAPIVEKSNYISVRTTDISNGKIDFQKANRVSLETYTGWTKRIVPKEGDIILAREAPVGEVGWIEQNKKVCLGQRTVLLRPEIEKIYPKYLLYYLANPATKYELVSQSTGSVVEHLNVKDIRGFELKVFSDLKEQQAIAEVLSSLDAKIDLLRRQNKTLEALAENLFRQWFVEEAEESWENGATYELGELIDTISKTFKFESSQVVFLNTSDIYAGQVLNHEYSNVDFLPGQAKKSIQKNDILYSEIRPANKRFAYVDFDAEDYVVSTKLMVLRTKSLISPAIIYFYLTNSQTLAWLQMLAESRSGTFPQITFDQVKEMKINVPTGEALQHTTDLTESTVAKLSENHKQIRILSNLRDTLLPKLMNGEMRVELSKTESATANQ